LLHLVEQGRVRVVGGGEPRRTARYELV
jgi:hypothetical protein